MKTNRLVSALTAALNIENEIIALLDEIENDVDEERFISASIKSKKVRELLARVAELTKPENCVL